MKKLIAMLLVLVTVCSLAACANTDAGNNTTTAATTESTTADDTMSYAEYVAAEMESEVTVLCYVQGHQSWWDNKITVYAADKDGAYFLYEMACTEEDAAKLTPGTAIKVTGYKGEWAGEVEIMDATFEFVDGETYVVEPVDLTDKLADEKLIDYQNQLASFKGLTVKEFSYKNGEPGVGNDIYLTLTKDGKDYNFCVESYLTDPESDVYKTVGTLKAGDVVDVEGFVYWYEGVNPHITAITVAE